MCHLENIHEWVEDEDAYECREEEYSCGEAKKNGKFGKFTTGVTEIDGILGGPKIQDDGIPRVGIIYEREGTEMKDDKVPRVGKIYERKGTNMKDDKAPRVGKVYAGDELKKQESQEQTWPDSEKQFEQTIFTISNEDIKGDVQAFVNQEE